MLVAFIRFYHLPTYLVHCKVFVQVLSRSTDADSNVTARRCYNSILFRPKAPLQTYVESIHWYTVTYHVTIAGDFDSVCGWLIMRLRCTNMCIIITVII